jgi:hypothetical protein
MDRLRHGAGLSDTGVLEGSARKQQFLLDAKIKCGRGRLKAVRCEPTLTHAAASHFRRSGTERWEWLGSPRLPSDVDEG